MMIGRNKHYRAHWYLLIALHAFIGSARIGAAQPEAGREPKPNRATNVDFNRDVRPILANRCFACHGPDAAQRQSELRLDLAEGATRPAASGAAAIIPRDADHSELVRRITAVDDERMPPPSIGAPLTSAEIATLKRWIDAGALYRNHWSFDPPHEPSWPKLDSIAESDRVWMQSPIDHFVLAKLGEADLHPSPLAEKTVILRRVYMDLIGLPPSLEEQNQFLLDDQPDAYERLVDRLLAMPAFGEHWGAKWLDLARYADSAGYADDPPRTIWAYRDWVIRALNSGMSFQQFTIDQLAGDMLPDPTDDQWIATAFHRNTMTNNEGGTNDEEFRNVAIVDRVNTSMAVWMGLTAGCAQCHDHKYDPLSQEDYFRLFAIFNQTADADRKDEAPVFEILTDVQKARRALLQQELANVKVSLNQLGAVDNTGESSDGSNNESNDERKNLQKRIKELENELKSVVPITTVPIFRELPSKQSRQTFIQLRGNYKVHGPQVLPGLPNFLMASKKLDQRNVSTLTDAVHSRANNLQSDSSIALTKTGNDRSVSEPMDDARPVNRLDFARWLVSRDNPLTARVAANRCWEALFGIGLVRTSEDFGIQGELPSHPELLDWLALRLIDAGWDQKSLIRSIVLSATYRQQSQVTPEAFQRDPDNRLLARGPRYRLSAEQVRDQALAASGLLNRKFYGEPVKPPQPKTGLKAAFGSGVDWEASQGANRHRRALYTTWRRTSPYPSMMAFDATSREVCVVRRERTNTPLQALVTLNDPVYIEASQALARRIARLIPNENLISARIGMAFQLILARVPTPSESEILTELYRDTRLQLATDPEKARKLATEPLGSVPERMTELDQACWTAIANVLFNLDEAVFMR